MTAKPFVDFWRGLGIELGILLMANRRKPVHYDAEKDELQEKVERWFNKFKSFRRIAARYDKFSRTHLAFLPLVATWIMAR